MPVIVTLALVFAKVALGSFGGGLAALPFIEYELCMARDWLTLHEFSEVVSLAQMTPGPVALNSATFVGYKLAGFWGALLASISLVTTPIILLLLLLFIIERSTGKMRAKVADFQKAMRPAVAGLVFSAFLTLTRPIIPQPILWGILASCALLLKFETCRKYPQLIILFGALAGLFCNNWLIS
ncbi:MAG: chromate transporter [Synergistaceae bacterium]|nr:chromate transporter [Synergistaceae bacterium]